MLSYEHIPYIATVAFILIMAILIIYLIRVVLNEKKEEKEFDKQLYHNLNPIEEMEETESFITRKLRVLPEQMIKAELVSATETVESIQKKLLLASAVLCTGTIMMSGQLLAGLLPVIFLYAGITGISLFKISKTSSIMEEQIPAFVSTFKANIQANQTAQNAMMNAIDNTASPLYSELFYAKAIMEAGDFKAGIIALRQNTDNETLRQMASCIELASHSGSNIENQIEIIEEIIEDKQKIERKKKLGVNENRPLFIIAALFVPLAFAGSYFMSDMHKEYWFKYPSSWIVIIAVLIVMAISAFATWRVIKKVDVY